MTIKHAWQIETFADVEEFYKNIKPVVSTKHTRADDVRPIGKRTRKYERIIKLRDDCYVFSCGGATDPIFNWSDAERIKQFPLTESEIEDLSPIVWRKAADGTETVSVRNGSGPWQHNSVYKFLRYALPRGLNFTNRGDGKHYVNGNLLPKGLTVPKHRYEYLKYLRTYNNAGSNNWARTDYDGFTLTFTRVGIGEWKLASPPIPEYIGRKRVNVESKRELAPHIRAMWSWCVTMYPIMRTNLSNQMIRENVEEALAWYNANLNVDENKVHMRYPNIKVWESLPKRVLNDIMTNIDHPMRHAFALCVMWQISFSLSDGWGRSTVDWEDHQSAKDAWANARATYNRWINQAFGFSKVEMELKK